MAKQIDIKEFESLTEAFQHQLGEGLISLVLFGSQARGTGLIRSDWDIFLIAEDLPDHPFERQIFLRKMMPPRFPFQVSIYAKTVKEFERDFPATYLDIAVDGLILFDRDGYAHEKLQQIQKIIEEAGLKRVKKFGHLIWKWESQPQFGWRIDWSGVYGLKRGSKLPIETL